MKSPAVLILLVVAATGASCARKTSSVRESLLGAGYGIAVSGTQRAFSETCFSVFNSDAIRSFSWRVQDFDGAARADYPGCSEQDGAQVCCTFQSPGERIIQLEARDRNGKPVKLTQSVSIAPPQGGGPTIVVDIRVPSGALAGTYSQDPSRIASAPIPSLTTTGFYTFDLSRSEANSASGDDRLKYEVSFGQGFKPFNGPALTRRFEESGFFPVTFRVTNSIGNASVARLQVFIQCADSAGREFTLDASKFKVAPTGTLNRYAYDFAGVLVGEVGQGQKEDSKYLYALDVNGDGIYDSPWQALKTSGHEDYSLYVSGLKYRSRQISLQVWDTQCNILRSATIHALLPAPKAPSAADPSFPGTELTGYDFLQADVDSLDPGPGVRGTDLSFMGTRPSGKENGRLTCSYARSGVNPDNPALAGEDAVLKISAQNAYPDPRGNIKAPHSMNLAITGIKDRTGGGAGSAAIDISQARIESAGYATDQQEDVQQQFVYFDEEPCDLSNFSLRTEGIPPVCDGSAGSASSTYFVTVAGDFRCIRMRNRLPLNVTSRVGIGDRGTGHFYCKVPVTDLCRRVHECVNGRWTDTGGACCEGEECKATPNPPGPTPGPGPGSKPGDGETTPQPPSEPPPPPPPAPRPPR